MGKGLSIQSNWARWSTVQALDSWLWDEASFPLGYTATYRLVGSTYASISAALAASNYGDIVVIPAGIYTEDLVVPNGVTIRAAANEIVTIYGQHQTGNFTTFRNLVFRKGALDCTFDGWSGPTTCWFEGCTFYIDHPVTVFQEGISGDITFNRCLITDDGTSSPAFFLVEGAGSCRKFTATSCVFDMRNGSKGIRLYDLEAFTFCNNTVLSSGYSDDVVYLYGINYLGDNYVNFQRNLFVSQDTLAGVFLDTVNIVANADMTVQYNYGFGYSSSSDFIDNQVGIDATNVSDVVSRAGVDGWYPRNEMPGKTTNSSGGLLVDFNGFAFEDPASCGAVQFQEEGSSVYRPRFDMDLLAGFSFVSSLAGAVKTPDSSMTTSTFYSPLECAAWINAYVQDVIHPARGAFFVSYDGTYRLVVTSGNFDLDLSGDAAVLLGTFNQTGLTDTGA